MNVFKPKALLYLARGDFILYLPKEAVQTRCDFPKGSIVALEITDSGKLEGHISNFLKAAKLKPHRLTIVLSEDIYFAKQIKVQDSQKIEKQIENFLDKVPFDSRQLAKKTFSQDGQLTTIATNKNLYEVVKNVFEGQKWTTEVVVPDLIFTQTKLASLSADRVVELLKNQKLLAHANLLSAQEPFGQESLLTRFKALQKEVLALAIVTAIAFIVLVLAIILGVKNYDFSILDWLRKKPPQNEINTQIIKEATPSPEVSPQESP